MHTDKNDNETSPGEHLHTDMDDNEPPPRENLHNTGNDTNKFSQSPTENLHNAYNGTSPRVANETETSHEPERNEASVGQHAVELRNLADKVEGILMERGDSHQGITNIHNKSS